MQQAVFDSSECDISVLKLLGFETFPIFFDKKVSDSVLKKIINKILDLGSWCTFNYWAGWFMALIAQNGLFQGQKCFLLAPTGALIVIVCY